MVVVLKYTLFYLFFINLSFRKVRNGVVEVQFEGEEISLCTIYKGVGCQTEKNP